MVQMVVAIHLVSRAYFIVCKILLPSLTICDTTFLTRSVQLISIQHQGFSDLLSGVCNFSTIETQHFWLKNLKGGDVLED
jgi:hypothetical protein